MMTKTLPYEVDLLEQAMTTPIEIVTTNHDEKLDHMEIVCKIDEDDVETSAFGLIYTLSCLSFRDARPAGASEMHYQDEDAWWAIDMLKCLRFSYGELTVDTSGRGTSASRWISTIQGKKVLTVIQGDKG